MLGLVTLSSQTQAACDLKVLSAYPCDSNGVAYNPKFGETYYLRITWAVTGTPSAPFSILFKMAGETYKWTGLNTGQGSGYYGLAGFNMPLDGPIPWSITLDPDHTSGDTNLSNNVIGGTMTPTPPLKALEYFNPKVHVGSETTTVPWYVGGKVTSGFTVMGRPVTDSFQVVNRVTGPVGSTVVKTPNDGDYVFKTPRSNYVPTASSNEWKDSVNFTVTVSGARTNIASLRGVTWAKEALAPTTVTPYLKPDLMCQSTNPSILAYVKSVLPSTYKTTMSPYDAAKAIYMAVVKRTVYQTPATQDSVTTLSIKKGDCGSFTNLVSACLRSIGIPSRANTGFWIGSDQWHVKGEFYLTGIGWIPFDASESRLLDTSGTYPYYFGSDGSLNNFCAVGRGDDHTLSPNIITYTQVGWLFKTGTAVNQPYGSVCNLQ